MKESLIADREEVLSDGGEVEKKKTEFFPGSSMMMRTN